MPVGSQKSGNPTKTPGERVDPSSATVGRTANTPMAGSKTVPAADGSDIGKPMHRKHRGHRKSESIVPDGTNSVGDISHFGVQADGSDAATMTGNPYPGSSRQGQ